jgi:hypothetical protein
MRTSTPREVALTAVAGGGSKRARQPHDRLASEHDADRWEALPLTDGESALAAIADWGPAEHWEDWADATR